MDDTELRSIVIATLKEIAPEIEEAGLRPERPLRQQVDLDSMDWLNFPGRPCREAGGRDSRGGLSQARDGE